MKPEHLTNEELKDSIDQLAAEVAMPGEPSPEQMLREYQEEAADRGLFY